MPVEIHTMPSDSIVFEGELTQRRLGAKARRRIVLCAPASPDDIAVLAASLAIADGAKYQLKVPMLPSPPMSPTHSDNDDNAKGDDPVSPVTSSDPPDCRGGVHVGYPGLIDTVADMETFGHLALSAVSGYPLLIVGTTARTFIHFSQIEAILDEEVVKSPCAFAVVTATREFRFFAATSVEYMSWMGAFSQAFANLGVNVRAQTYRATNLDSDPDVVADTNTGTGDSGDGVGKVKSGVSRVSRTPLNHRSLPSLLRGGHGGGGGDACPGSGDTGAAFRRKSIGNIGSLGGLSQARTPTRGRSMDFTRMMNRVVHTGVVSSASAAPVSTEPRVWDSRSPRNIDKLTLGDHVDAICGDDRAGQTRVDRDDDDGDGIVLDTPRKSLFARVRAFFSHVNIESRRLHRRQAPSVLNGSTYRDDTDGGDGGYESPYRRSMSRVRITMDRLNRFGFF